MIEEAVSQALARLHDDADVAPTPARLRLARTAMHGAVHQHAATRRWQLRWPHLSPRAGFAAASFAGAMAAVLMMGWSAPAGTPLHGVELAREWMQVSLPGSDTTTLTLSFAEKRLDDAASGRSDTASITEARHLLDECRPYVSAEPSSPESQRWRHDEAMLASLQRQIV